MSVTLPDRFYYLHNFCRVLEWVATRYDDLLVEEERQFIRTFAQLPQASQALLVRMLMRKGECFRTSRLHYDEIGCPSQAAEALLQLGWLEHDTTLDINELCALLRKHELLNAFGVQRKHVVTKRALQAELAETFTEPRTLAQWQVFLDDQIYRVTVTRIGERFRLLFFGNLHQDWSEFVLSDLGIYRFEQVALSAESRAFQSRQDIDDYLHLHRCRQRIEDQDCPQEIAAELPQTPYGNSWLEMRRHRLFFLLGQQCERRAMPDHALEHYRQSRHAGARLRVIRILEKQQAIGKALELAESALSSPENEAEVQSLQRMLPRLRRACGLMVEKHHFASPARHDLPLPFPAYTISVELLVAQQLQRDDAPVLYVENTLFNSLFGLLCWSAIFAPLPGAFFHPYHHGPADLGSADFYARRRPLFDVCLQQLEDERYKQSMRDCLARKHGLQSPFVYWHCIDDALLDMALDCIPPQHLRAVFTRMLGDLAHNRSGFPDLIQFIPAERRYRLIEVKGPGDRLQDNQRRWMQFFMQHEIPVEVCHVQWLSAEADQECA